MSLAKNKAKELIDKLPEQATWDDIIYEFYVKKKLVSRPTDYGNDKRERLPRFSRYNQARNDRKEGDSRHAYRQACRNDNIVMGSDTNNSASIKVQLR